MAALEIWNEPNYSYFFQSSAPAADYAALLKAAYPRIKQVAPDLTVLGPAMLGSDAPFLEELYSAGIGGYYDGISSRPFNVGADPRDTAPSRYGRKHSFLLGVPWVREAMVAHGDGDKKLWFTELGWSSCGPGGTNAWCVTRETQARYVADSFRVIRDCWDYVDSVSIYNTSATRAPTRTTASRRWASCSTTSRPSPPTPPSGTCWQSCAPIRGPAARGRDACLRGAGEAPAGGYEGPGGTHRARSGSAADEASARPPLADRLGAVRAGACVLPARAPPGQARALGGAAWLFPALRRRGGEPPELCRPPEGTAAGARPLPRRGRGSGRRRQRLGTRASGVSDRALRAACAGAQRSTALAWSIGRRRFLTTIFHLPLARSPDAMRWRKPPDDDTWISLR